PHLPAAGGEAFPPSLARRRGAAQRPAAAKGMKCIVAGGGIGGMALGLSLNDAGLRDVEIHESAPAVKELGVGINILPHAVRELGELGLLDDLGRVAIATAEWCLYSPHGQRIWAEPRGLAAGYRWPQFSIHRGALLGVLHRAA